MPPEPAYCQTCGAPVVAEGDRYRCTRCARRHYVNSKPCAGALVVRDGRVLLVKRAFEPFKGWWDVPGGFLNAGEHPEEGVRRELREETGLEVEPRRLVGIYMDTYGDDGDPTLNIYYECAVVGGEPRPADDALEIGWFAPDALPEQVAFANAHALLRDWRAGR
ncbi:MAG TPA: NUDIX hydrolase [Chloroflexota bacterium]|nr:NUDIX hydrolase [Chloroflexota bacterium]